MTDEQDTEGTREELLAQLNARDELVRAFYEQMLDRAEVGMPETMAALNKLRHARLERRR
jgi:hypothetical protein